MLITLMIYILTSFHSIAQQHLRLAACVNKVLNVILAGLFDI